MLKNLKLQNLKRDFEIKMCVKFQLNRFSLVLNSCQPAFKTANNSCKTDVKKFKYQNLSLSHIIELCAEFQLDRLIISFNRGQTANNSC